MTGFQCKGKSKLLLHFDGAVKKFSAGNFSTDHSFNIFDSEGDGLNEFIHKDKRRLAVYDCRSLIVEDPDRFLYYYILTL